MQSPGIAIITLGLLAGILPMGCVQQEPQAPPISAGSSLPAAAQGVPGRFDGMWQVESAAISFDPSGESPSGCGSIDLKFQVKDSQIVGGLKRTPYGASVESSTGFLSAPMSGTVQPDGTVNLTWERYVVTGRMTGDKVQLQWKGECGPRVASGARVSI